MIKQGLLTFSIGLSLILFSCNGSENKNDATVKDTIPETQKLNAFLDKSFDEMLERHPMYQTYLGIKKDYDKWDNISPEEEERELEITKKELEALKKNFNYEKLDQEGKISYNLFVYNTNMKIDGFKFRFHNYAVNQLFSLHTEIPSILINMHHINDSADASAYLSRLEKIEPLFDQLIRNLKLREEKGVLPPKFVFPMVIKDCNNIIEGKPFTGKGKNSTLLEDFTTKVNKLDSMDKTQKETLIKRCNQILLEKVKPAYEKLIAALKDQEKKADDKDGAWKLPDGDAYYAYSLKNTTTTDLKPEEIFSIGDKEVSRIHDEMRGIMKQVGFKGDNIQEFFKSIKKDKSFYYPSTEEGKQVYLEETNKIIDSMKARLDELFITKPKADLVVKPVEKYREQSTASAFYQEPAPDGSRPGIYYVNMYDMTAVPKYEMEALAYHEAIPGHHMQISIAQELTDIPKFRKYGSFTAYIEGWGLYSELVPKQFGFYKDPYSDFGRLSMELWRACRLVVDVGIHYKKWTRQQAIDYLTQNTPNSETDCAHEVERYIVWPSQATAYKIGMLKIVELREKAKKELGEKFDIRQYHDVVLRSGALPLNMLEDQVNVWISKVKSGV